MRTPHPPPYATNFLHLAPLRLRSDNASAVNARRSSTHTKMGSDMKPSIAKSPLVLPALLVLGLGTATIEKAEAVVYCKYIGYPKGCVAAPGVVLVARPVARAVVTPGVGAVGVGVRPGTPMNRGGPVNRVGRR
jgi:hypothetical protein